MTTPRDIIRLVFQSIEMDIEHAQWAIEYAEKEIGHLIEQKKDCESARGYVASQLTYNESLGYYHGIIFDNKQKIEAYKGRLDYWKSLDEKCAEEEEGGEEE